MPDSTPNAMDFYPSAAVEWRVGPPEDWQRGWSEIRVITQLQRDGSTKYAVKMRGWTATRDCEWEYEPQPSSRDDYLERCRWGSWEDAMLVAQKMVVQERRKWLDTYGERMKRAGVV